MNFLVWRNFNRTKQLKQLHKKTKNYCIRDSWTSWQTHFSILVLYHSSINMRCILWKSIRSLKIEQIKENSSITRMKFNVILKKNFFLFFIFTGIFHGILKFRTIFKNVSQVNNVSVWRDGAKCGKFHFSLLYFWYSTFNCPSYFFDYFSGLRNVYDLIE